MNIIVHVLKRLLNWLDPDEPTPEELPKTIEVWQPGLPPVAARPIAVRGLVLIVQYESGETSAVPAGRALDRQLWGKWWRKLGGSAHLEGGEPYDPSEG